MNGTGTATPTTTSSSNGSVYVEFEFTFTKEQIFSVALIPIFPAILSMMSSLLIISSILRKRRREKRSTSGHGGNNSGRNRGRLTKPEIGPYDRILFAMSGFDLLFSATLILSPFMTPSGYWWPTENHFGNANTCRFIGTMTQFSLSNLLYCGCLALYFLLTIRFHIRQETIEKRVEPWMHGVAISVPAITAIAGGIIDFYDEKEFFPGCWIDNYPKGCVGDECWSTQLGYICSGVPVCMVIVVLVISYSMVFWYVRRRYGRQASLHQMKEPSRWNIGSSTRGLRRNDSRNGELNNALCGGPSVGFASSTAFTSGHPQDSLPQSESRQPSSLFLFLGSQTKSNSCSPSATTQLTGSMHPIGQANRVRLVSTQAALYVGSSFLTFSWYYILQILEGMDGEDVAHLPVFPLMMMQAFFTPLAGFWTALIFFRPRYIHLRRHQMRIRERQLEQRRKRQQNSFQFSSSASSSSDGDDGAANWSRWEIVRMVLFEPNKDNRQNNLATNERNEVIQIVSSQNGLSEEPIRSEPFLRCFARPRSRRKPHTRSSERKSSGTMIRVADSPNGKVDLEEQSAGDSAPQVEQSTRAQPVSLEEQSAGDSATQVAQRTSVEPVLLDNINDD